MLLRLVLLTGLLAACQAYSATPPRPQGVPALATAATHAPAGVREHTPAPPGPQSSPLLQVTRDTTAAYAVHDRPDDVEGYQVHFIYALPSDGADAFLDVNGGIELSAQAMNHWLLSQTGYQLRYDTYQGQLDITFMQLPYTAAQISETHSGVNDLVEHWIKINGLAQEHKLYVVYYDGLLVTPEGFCGLAAFPPKGIGQTAVLLLRGYNPTYDLTCPRNFTKSVDFTGFFEITILHEVLHLLGLAADCAPHAEGGHVNDSAQDLMYFQYDGSYSPLFTMLDYGNDDYYNHGRSDCPDLARSVFLEPLPAQAEPPPRWMDSIRNTPPNPIGGAQ